MKFKKYHTLVCLAFCSFYHFLFLGIANPHSKVTFLGVSSSTLPARMSEQLNLPPNIYLSVDQSVFRKSGI